MLATLAPAFASRTVDLDGATAKSGASAWLMPTTWLRTAAARLRGRSLRRTFAAAQIALGERMYAVGLDDGETFDRLAEVESKLCRSALAGDPTRSLKRKRDALLRRLADAALQDDAPLPGADPEFQLARAAKTALDGLVAS